jgi:hypothetical protein
MDASPARVDDGVQWLRTCTKHPANLRRKPAGATSRRSGSSSLRRVNASIYRPSGWPTYLDTYPFGSPLVNGALFAGLPVVTLAGRSMASRASASQLGAVGLPDLVAHTREEYAAIALALTRDRSRLAAIATILRERGHASPLFDMGAYTRDFEVAVMRMYRDRADGVPVAT